MGFLIALLTVGMVFDCIILVLLVLIQLPKKEAGAGLAFGGGATDALFGAGSGTVLTKITKYAAGIFFGLAIVLSIMQSYYHGRNASQFQQSLSKGAVRSSMPAAPAPAPASPATAPSPAVPLTATNDALIKFPEATNVPAAPANATPAGSNAPSAPK
ncbi:MAG TPA: preprotein translocase subunit SecG [Candidatus Dormibacteraeota bacterium]|nr:preprotein translocase subunit SecG [Candidatus Dormibacteraeota bacterium]